jgi:transcriptional regulator with XRE-family HTH domain
MAGSLSTSLASTLRSARLARKLSTSSLAEASGVSQAMISKIERGEAQPTAVLLGRLSGALGMTLSELVARAENDERRLARAADQLTWTDPGSGYRRRAVSPSTTLPLQLVEVDLPPGAVIAYPAEAYSFSHHQIWVLAGCLRFREGDVEHELRAGDCLALGPPAPCSYVNSSNKACRYLVAVTRNRP